jgi:hypothetical protein
MILIQKIIANAGKKRRAIKVIFIILPLSVMNANAVPPTDMDRQHSCREGQRKADWNHLQ